MISAGTAWSQKDRIKMENGDKIVLVSMEGEKHPVDLAILDMSEYLKGMKESGSIKSNTISLENIKEVSLKRIIDFCERCVLVIIVVGTYHLDKPLAGNRTSPEEQQHARRGI